MPRPISASISVPALSHNLAHVASQLSTISKQGNRSVPKIWAVIKANGYGHGIYQAINGFACADGLAMLDLDEAVRCREAGWNKPILLLEGFFEPRDLAVLADYSLTFTLHSQEQLDILAHARWTPPLDAWLKLNTGMNRLGFSPERFSKAYEQALKARAKGLLRTIGKMTHFARADDSIAVTQEQMRIFTETTGALPGPVSVCNSAATLTPQHWLAVPDDVGQWVRPGICLYGSSPFADRSADELGLLPAMTLQSQIIGVQTVQAGGGIGYGHGFVAERAMRIGVVACGYADGYPRHAPNGTPIAVAGSRTRLLGRVSMDMLCVDLSDIPHAGVGAPVVLWGEGGPSVDEVAQAAGTIGYELLCALAPRVPAVVSLLEPA